MIQKHLHLFAQGKTSGVFQLESDGLKRSIAQTATG